MWVLLPARQHEQLVLVRLIQGSREREREREREWEAIKIEI